MSNTFGRLFRLTTFGESHGLVIGGVIDGCPAGLTLSEFDIQMELDRRKPGQNKFVTPRKEDDEIQILSGVFEGKTTGTSIGLQIKNTNVRSQDYTDIKDQFRPGHADYTYQKKFGIRDYRGGGRASARETALRVAGGAIAKKILSLNGIEILGWLEQIGELKAYYDKQPEWDTVNSNAFFAPNTKIIKDWEDLLTNIRRDKDSVGASIRIVARNVPAGLGEPLFDKLDAMIAYAMMGIPAVKAVSLGSGFDAVTSKGSDHNDEIRMKNGHMRFQSNHSGGTLGGISSGQDIIVDIAVKPTSSIALTRRSVDINGNNIDIETHGRHDPCVGIRAVPIAEAMLAMVLCDALLIQKSRRL